MPRAPAALARRPLAATLLAVAVRSFALILGFEVVGARSAGRALTHIDGAWIVAVAAAQLATYPAYVLAYRSILTLGRHERMPLWTATRLVVAGFGPVTLTGGFGIDRAALATLGDSETAARARVRTLSVMEWAVLAPATSVVALSLLISGSGVPAAESWPWAAGVPLGVAGAVWATGTGPAERLARWSGRRRERVAGLLDAIRAVSEMARRPRRSAGVWLGVSAYWCSEIVTLFAASRAVGLDLGARATVLAYASGYLGSRRSLPLGGAGLAEGLLVVSLWQLGCPPGRALAAVVIYRAFNFVAVIIPSLLACRGLGVSLLRAPVTAAEDGVTADAP